MEKEQLREKIAEQLLRITKTPICKLDDSTSFGKELRGYADKILALIPDIPKDKPPLLSEEDGHEFRRASETELIMPAEDAFDYGFGEGAQAQWEIDVKHYEGVKDTSSRHKRVDDSIEVEFKWRRDIHNKEVNDA